nr:hypothetical protein [Aestuariicella albida]
MLILPALVAVLVSVIRGKPLPASLAEFHPCACWGLGVAFLFFSMGHVVQTAGMIEMLPPWMPWRESLVYATGALEMAIGLALFIPRWQLLAAKLAAVVLIVFFPANVYAALNSVGLGGHQWGPVYLLIRGPLQLLLLGWTWFLCIAAADVKPLKNS